MAFDLGRFQEKLAFILEYASLMRRAGILFTEEPVRQHIDRKSWVYTSLLGDPAIHARGIPFETKKITQYTDVTLQVLSEILRIPYRIEIISRDYTQYTPIATGELYWKPEWTYSYTVQPVYMIPNFDKSLTDPGDLGPSEKWFVLSKANAYQAIALYTLCYYLTMLFTWDEMSMFVMMTDQTYGAKALITMAKDVANIDLSPIYDQIMRIKQTTSLIQWAHNALKRQLFANTGYRELLTVIGDPTLITEYDEVTQQRRMWERLVEACIASKGPTTVVMITDMNFTTYDLQGTTGTRITRTYSLNSDGTYCQFGFKAEPILSQSVLKSLKLFKQVVRKPRGSVPSETLTQYKTANIPCSNWDEVENLTETRTITQYARSVRGVVQNTSDVFSQLRSVLQHPSTLQGQARWNALTGELEISSTHITAN